PGRLDWRLLGSHHRVQDALWPIAPGPAPSIGLALDRPGHVLRQYRRDLLRLPGTGRTAKSYTNFSRYRIYAFLPTGLCRLAAYAHRTTAPALPRAYRA